MAKCSDSCCTGVPELKLEKNGSIPRGIGIGGGDYIRMVIDSNTGRIDGWVPLSEEDLREAIPDAPEYPEK